LVLFWQAGYAVSACVPVTGVHRAGQRCLSGVRVGMQISAVFGSSTATGLDIIAWKLNKNAALSSSFFRPAKPRFPGSNPGAASNKGMGWKAPFLFFSPQFSEGRLRVL
jgi:hypothetical protein